jgi:DNA-binding transcriptional LysR family regulator
MRKLNLDQLHAFEQVVSLGSFSAAAQLLNLTQPAVSLQVRQLERRLGVRLVERLGRRIGPTAAGSELLPHIRRIEAAVAEAVDRMSEHAEAKIGRVRLGTGATACTYLLPQVLRGLRRRFPRLDIVVSTGNTPEILKALEDNAIDIAFATLPAPKRLFVATPILEDEIVAVFAAGDAPAEDGITARNLGELPVVLYEPGARSRRIIDDWLDRAGVSLKPVMELGNVEAIKELVGAGLGCGLLPALALRNAGSAPIVARPLIPRLRRTLGIVLRRDKIPDRGLRAVIEALTALRDPELSS